MTRNASIDALKGLLILLVIIGHILLGTLDDNILRYIIYSFHMSVFLFISGYLLNLDKISSLSGKALFIKYWKRMLLPWFIASVVYSLCLLGTHFTFRAFASLLLHPYYHLWYVPTLFIFIIVTWLSSYIKERSIAFILLVALALLLANLFVQINTIRLDSFVFFIMGMVARHVKLKVADLRLAGGTLCMFLMGIILLGLCNVSMDFYNRNLRLPSMIPVCLFSVMPVIIREKLRSPMLSYVGEHSLEIYLWHVLPLMLLKHFFSNPQMVYIYYLLSFCLLLIFIAFVRLKTNKISKSI